jgi:alpha-galactosidase
MKVFTNRFYTLSLGESGGELWSYEAHGASNHSESRRFGGPEFLIDGDRVDASEIDLAQVAGSNTGGAPAAGNVRELSFAGEVPSKPDLTLTVTFRVSEDSPIVRLRYALSSGAGHRLTNGKTGNELVYLRPPFPLGARIAEVRFSEFNAMLHSFCVVQDDVPACEFDGESMRMGPMLVGESAGWSELVAYEHGSQFPDAFLSYALRGDGGVELRAVKGNYYDGRVISDSDPYDTVWFQYGCVAGSVDELAGHYRTFQLKYASPNVESRKPYIFYNTWAFQERNKWWNGKAYLDSMNEQRILSEIEVAHQMGIEVFVLDTGWYEKTGDWAVSRVRFPHGLGPIKEKLDQYGMKLGLWFNPKAAAVSSRMLANNADCVVTRGGVRGEPRSIWETEESHSMCLVSRYWEDLADELVRTVRDFGVTYFKWDAIGQYGCDDPNHYHGSEANTTQERADCYAFEIGRYMSKVVDRLCAECPEAIVDFDITEGGRYVGLGFLASGKYFLINNGPYYRNYDIPQREGEWSNIFVHPGPARPWICRSPLDFDSWIPSVLFLTHYLPDDPRRSQTVNIASLILGQNGIWGDLLGISEEGRRRFARMLGMYKEIREDLTESTPVRQGIVGGGLEVHEKLNTQTGRGAVVLFSSSGGTFQYVTRQAADQAVWSDDATQVGFDDAGRASITTQIEEGGATVVFFGVHA